MAVLRLFRVCTTGPYFNLFSRFVDTLGDASFDAAIEACRRNGFLYPADLKKTLEAEGAAVMEVIVDMAPLQQKWLREAGEDPARHNNVDTFFRQLEAFRPDVVHFQTFFALPHHVRAQIKSRCPWVKLVTGHRGFPILDCRGYEDVDAVFLGYPRHHEHWHAVGVKTFAHNHTFDASLLPAIREGITGGTQHDFTFIGTTGWGFGPHDGRYFDLRKLLGATNLEVWGNEPERTTQVNHLTWRQRVLAGLQHLPLPMLAAMASTGRAVFPMVERAARAAMQMKRELAKAGADVPTRSAISNEFWYHKELPIRELFPDRIHPPVFGLDYFRLLASSQITWNRHLEMDGAGANMRLFEACGAGTCQVTDYRPEVVAAFEPDTEVVIYRTVDECIDKVRYLLDHESERVKIAQAGQARALRDHSTAVRARDMLRHMVELA